MSLEEIDNLKNQNHILHTELEELKRVSMSEIDFLQNESQK